MKILQAAGKRGRFNADNQLRRKKKVLGYRITFLMCPYQSIKLN